MMSKNSFINALNEDRKRRTWTIIVFAFLCFLLTAAFELNIEICELNCASNGITLLESLTKLTEYEMLPYYVILSGIAAVLFGFQGFGWLTKKDQVDFYHSQPMKREKRFAVIYFNGILFFVSCMVLHIVAAALLIGARECLTGAIFSNFVLNAGVFIISFLLFYSIIALAIMMTGNMIVSGMAALTFLFYPSVVKYLFQAYYMTFFDTYCAQYSNPMKFLGQIAPNEQVISLINMVIRGVDHELGMAVLTTFVMAIVIFLASLYLYKKRPSECAGNALAFPVTKSIIRIFIVIPAAMLFGIMFYSFSGMYKVFWIYFGTILGAVLSHGFMEAVFQFDIKTMFKKKLQLVVSIVIAVAIVCVFQMDLTGYDEYLPKEKNVKEISYYIDVTEQPNGYVKLDEEGIPVAVTKNDGTEDNHAVDLESYELQNSATKEVKPILKMVESHVKKENNDESSVKRVIICYGQKNGKKIYRQYDMDVSLLKEYYAPIYNTEKGKEVHHPYLQLSSKKINAVVAYAPYMEIEQPLNLTEKEIEELVECYKKDIKARNFDQFFEEMILGNLIFSYENEVSHETISIAINVSSTYENMLGFLEEKGVYLNLPNENYGIEEVVANNPLTTEDTKNHPFWKDQYQVKLTDAQAAEVVPYLMSDEYIYSYDKEDYRYYFDVTIRNKKTGTKRQMFYYVREKNVPEYMIIK